MIIYNDYIDGDKIKCLEFAGDPGDDLKHRYSCRRYNFTSDWITKYNSSPSKCSK